MCWVLRWDGKIQKFVGWGNDQTKFSNQPRYVVSDHEACRRIQQVIPTNRWQQTIDFTKEWIAKIQEHIWLETMRDSGEVARRGGGKDLLACKNMLMSVSKEGSGTTRWVTHRGGRHWRCQVAPDLWRRPKAAVVFQTAQILKDKVSNVIPRGTDTLKPTVCSRRSYSLWGSVWLSWNKKENTLITMFFLKCLSQKA